MSRRTSSKARAVATFQPLPWQYAPWRDKSAVLLLTGAAGGGKSKLAAEKINAYMLKYPGARGLLIRKAREFATKSMVPALKAAIGSPEIAQYRKADLTFEYANGSRVYVAGVKDEDQREALRSIGEQGGVDVCWIEEANALTYEAFQEIRARMRGTVTTWRQVILTTNPGGPAHWIKKRLIDGGLASPYYSRATDNPHLPADYLETLESLTGVQYDRLVLGLWKAAEGALWDHDIIEAGRVASVKQGDLTRIVVAVDPAVTNTKDSDETGIVVVGIDGDRHAYVLDDKTLKGSPATWARAAVNAYERWDADAIIAETNNGGDMVESTIHTEDRRARVIQVRASRGKHTRAEPVAALYERGEVHHVGVHHELENQLTSWVPGESSPDRMDALVWAVTELLLGVGRTAGTMGDVFGMRR